jgi:intracellular septation protein
MRQLVRPICEVGPLVLFFLANSKFGIFTGTAVFVVATAIAVPVNWYFERKVPIMPLVSGFFVLVFGGLTLWLNDDLFIKLKPTIVNLLFAAILTTGILLGRNFLKIMFGTALTLDEEGWRVLTLRWIGFFVVLAILNEVTRRYFSTDMWVAFKTFGALPLTLVFTFCQFPLIKRHWAGEKNPFA